MRILSLARTYPWPPEGGSELRIWNMVSGLARRHDVRMLVAKGPGPRGAAPATPGLAIEALPAESPAGRSAAARGARFLKAIVTGVPASVLGVSSSRLGERTRQLCAEGWPDVVVAEEGAAGSDLRFVPERIPRVLVKHSVHARQAEEEAARGGRARLLAALEPWITRRFEAATLALASSVIVLTPEDEDELRARYGPRTFTCVPNGIDRRCFPPRPDPGGAVVGCLANFEWHPNVREAIYLAREVWPLVRARRPDATLRLVGKGLSTNHADLARPGITCSGFVPDVGAAFADVTAGVVPVLLGSGIRNRTLALLSMGVPLVTTPLGARGLGLRDGTDARVASTPEGIASAILDLLGDRDQRSRLAAAGERVAERFTWEQAIDGLERALGGGEAARSRIAGFVWRHV